MKEQLKGKIIGSWRTKTVTDWPKCHHPDFKKFRSVVKIYYQDFFKIQVNIFLVLSVFATQHESRLKWRLRGGWEAVSPKDILMVQWVKGNCLDLPDRCFVSPWLPASCNPNEPICLMCSLSSLLLSCVSHVPDHPCSSPHVLKPTLPVLLCQVVFVCSVRAFIVFWNICILSLLVSGVLLACYTFNCTICNAPQTQLGEETSSYFVLACFFVLFCFSFPCPVS